MAIWRAISACRRRRSVRPAARIPLPVLIPCHRVLAADGLGGFSAKGGVETKVALLRLEGAASLLI